MKRIVISLFSLGMVICLLICGITIIYDSRDVSFNQEKVTFLSNGWFYYSEGGQRVAFTIPNKIPSVKGEPFVIYKTFQESIPAGVSLGFRSSQQEVSISLDDEVIYSYGKPDAVPTFPNTPASAWNIVELPQIHPGQILKISLLSPYSFFQGRINMVMLGSKSAILFHIATRYFPAFCATTLVLILGVALFFYGIYIYKILHSANFIYLGVFALLLGIWFFGDSMFTQFFLGYTLLPYQMIFLSIALIPIPGLLFFSSALHSKNQRMYELLCFGAITNFFAMVTAQTMGLVDFFDWLPISHFILFLSMILVLFSMAQFIREYTYKRARFLFLGFSIFFFSGLLDILFFYIVNKNHSLLFIQTGTLLALVIIAKGEINKNLELIKIGFEAAAFKKAAYTDALTQIGNRYAFDLVLEELARGEQKEHIENAICIIDVDGLKFANDTYGHWMGDQLICSMAECLKAAFYGYGKYFRIGGDEFAVILTGDKGELQEYLSRLKEAIVLKNKNCKCNLSASWGMAFQSDTEGNSIYEAFQMADALMYRDKESKKERCNLARTFGKNVTNKFKDM